MKRHVVLIGGPTASGKTKFAIRYAQKLRELFGVESEIVNADSIQLYNDLKIITAYPSEQDMNEIPHHLFGILSPNDMTSVASWLNLANNIIDDICSRHKVAIVCGGTGLYLRALINGIAKIPDIPPDFRQKVFEHFNMLGRDKFFEELVRLDPSIVNTLHQNNTQRILRAYEVVAYTGTALSEWWNNTQKQQRNVKQIILLPPKEELHSRCLARIQNMISNGAIEEMHVFMKKYPNYHGPLCKVIGYKEILAFLSGQITQSECIEQMYIHTRQYAKRQITWFKHQTKIINRHLNQ